MIVINRLFIGILFKVVRLFSQIFPKFTTIFSQFLGNLHRNGASLRPVGCKGHKSIAERPSDKM